jgi:predicted outer membrane repeat protein
MYNNWCGVTVTGCSFSVNTASHNGGAVYNTSSSATFRSCLFRENQASNGGAIYMNGLAGEDATQLENCLVEGNRAYVSGGGIYILRSVATMVNCTITENIAIYGGGISCWHSPADIVNCIVWGNTFFYSSPAIEVGTDIVPTVRHCNIDQVGYGLPSDGSVDSDGNFRFDPLFTDGPLGGRYLSQTASGQAAQSPCVDAGAETALSAWLKGFMTTRTDGGLDAGSDDIGFHYSP